MTPKRTSSDVHRIYWKAECQDPRCTWHLDVNDRVDDAHDRARRHTIETGHPTFAVGEVEVEYRATENAATS